MSKENDKLNELQQRLDSFLRNHEQMQKEMLLLRSEIRSLQLRKKFETKESDKAIPVIEDKVVQKEKDPRKKDLNPVPQMVSESFQQKKRITELPVKQDTDWLDFEKLIGENIINKIGIVITVIGIAIGSNYVIENNLISPEVRIIIGYIFSFGLAGVAYRLKDKYLNYSAVLMGGAMACLYMLTYASYDFYAIISQLSAFIIMALITIVTVGTAIGYNKEWVSVFGLVGGYAVPFLVGGNSGSTIILFSYILFINIGVLVVAFQKYWRILQYSAFGFTWMIFLYWFSKGFNFQTDVAVSLTFSTLFFLIFYASGLAYKVRNSDAFYVPDISTLLINTFLYFGLIYKTLDYEYSQYHGLFTVMVAAIHFAAGRIVRYFDSSSPTPLNLINGLVLVFLTLAIPIQFQDQWITMAWSLEAVLLLWLGRVKRMKIYETLSYPVMVLAFFGLIGEWGRHFIFSGSSSTLPFINSLFGTFLVFWFAFVGIQYVLFKHSDDHTFRKSSFKNFFYKFGVPFVLVFALYLSLLFEVSRIFNYWEAQTSQKVDRLNGWYATYNPAIDSFKSLWKINYSFLFFGAAVWINKRWFNLKGVEKTNIALLVITLFFFLAAFFSDVKFLRELYIGFIDNKEFPQSIFNILNRYILIIFAVFGVYALRDLLKRNLPEESFRLYFELFLSFFAIFLLSSELIQWLDIAGFENSYKLGLSILWGICSLTMIIFGILTQREHIRIAAMAVFSITLIKLFFYDISHLSTISKTVVFLSLGILLLIISYFYNRFKDQLIPENQIDEVNE